MQLRTARLCHDCEEIHEDQRCPVCASEAFAYITRWIPVPERRPQPRETSSPELEVYRQLIAEDEPSRSARLLKQALIGLTTVGVAGWVWRRSQGPPHAPDASRARTPSRVSDGPQEGLATRLRMPVLGRASTLGARIVPGRRRVGGPSQSDAHASGDAASEPTP